VRRHRRRLVGGATSAAVALLLSSCGLIGGNDMDSSDAQQQLRRATERLAELTGDGEIEVREDDFTTCEPNVYDGNVVAVYSGSVPLVPDAVELFEQQVVPAMEEDGWTLRRRESEAYTAFNFGKDGFLVGATVPTGGSGDKIALSGTSPCVEDDGTTGITHDP
jgi:hypothetical protein